MPIINRSSHKKINFNITSKLLLVILLLLSTGILMIYDATFVSSQQTYGKPWVFAMLQFGWIIVGLIGFIFFYFMDYKNIRRMVYPVFLFSLATLVLLAIIGIFPCNASFSISPCINGANRWLYFPLNLPIVGSVGFQPTELMKLAIILYLAAQLSGKLKNEDGFWFYFSITMLVSLLTILQPNMSTATMIFLIATSVYVVSGNNIKPFIYLIPVMFVLIGLLMIASPYRRERVLTYLSMSKSTETDESLGRDYHVKQISIALGSGGFSGLGLGQSRQKYNYLPEVGTDSIFAIIGEEFGFVGTTGIVLVYAYFLYLGYTISSLSKDDFGKLISAGITSWIGLQFLINITSMTNLIPLTGIPLPLISYGGSSMVFTLAGLGILANISKDL